MRNVEQGEHQEIPDTRIQWVAYCEGPRSVQGWGKWAVCRGRDAREDGHEVGVKLSGGTLSTEQ